MINKLGNINMSNRTNKTVSPIKDEYEFAVGHMSTKQLETWISEHPDSWVEIDGNLPNWIEGKNIKFPVLGDEFELMYPDAETARHVTPVLSTVLAKFIDGANARFFFNTENGEFYFSTTLRYSTVVEVVTFVGANFKKLYDAMS